MPRTTSPARKAFTLVEMLVVIVIMVILAALLFPALARARERARGVSCQNNLRQIGMAVVEYADQNNGIFPPFRWNDIGTAAPTTPPPMGLAFGEERIIVSRPRWNLLIGPHLEGSIDTDVLDPDGDGLPNYDDDHTPFGNGVFLCPTASERTTSRNGAYGYNYQFVGHTRQFRETGIARPYGKPWVNFPVSQGSIKVSHRTVIAADCLGTASWLPERDRQPYSGETNLCAARGNHSYALDPPVPYFQDGNLIRMGYVSEGDCETATTGGFSGVDARHSGRVNVAFLDGHTGSMTPQELGYVVREDGSFAYKNLAELFRDLNGNGVPDRKDEWLGSNEWFSGKGIHTLLPLQWR